MCNGRADEHVDRISTEQSEFPETSTGSDGRGHLHVSDGSKMLNSILTVFGIDQNTSKDDRRKRHKSSGAFSSQAKTNHENKVVATSDTRNGCECEGGQRNEKWNGSACSKAGRAGRGGLACACACACACVRVCVCACAGSELGPVLRPRTVCPFRSQITK